MKTVKAWAIVTHGVINDLDGRCLQIFFNENSAKHAAAEESYRSQQFEVVLVEIRPIRKRKKEKRWRTCAR